MSDRASPDRLARYDAVARGLHWAMAVLIIANLLSGFLNDALEGIVRVIPLHKSIGLTVLALSLFRLAWRFVGARPPLPAAMPPWERAAAQMTHAAFYALMIALPLSGWIFSSAGKYPLDWFGLFPVPKFAVTKADAIYTVMHDGHEAMGVIAAVLIALHVGAALRHHFVLRDTVLRRMA